MNLNSFVAVLFILVSTTARTETYRNDNYGMRLEIPTGRKICPFSPAGTNHGFSLPLAPMACGQMMGVPRIDLFVAYNVPYEAASTPSLTEHDCDGQKAVKSSILEQGLPYYRCPETMEAGVSGTTYVLLRPFKGEPVFDWAELVITLYAPRKSVNAYQSDLMSILHGVSFDRAP
jgi:hypothetical protein